jgi:hypothetical protein
VIGVPEDKAIDFVIPPDIQAHFDQLASMHGSLVAYIGKKAGFEPEEVSELVFRLTEAYGAMQVLTVLFASKCQDKVQRALQAYKLILEAGQHLIYSENPSRMHVRELINDLFDLKVAIIMLIADCSGLPAIVKAPPEPSTGTSQPLGR